VGDVLAQPRAWILVLARGLTDASWNLLLFWMVLYLQRGRGFTDLMVAHTVWIPYATADLGALFGGWFSAQVIRRGMPLIAARRWCMLGFASLMTLTLAGFAAPSGQPYLALALFSIATFGHMAWGTNQLTLHSDLFPEERVATIMGITGAAGSIGGIIAGQSMGGLVDQLGTYLPVFITTACLHPLAGALVFVGLRKSGRDWESQSAELRGQAE
jgi:ACS family hexuronate transporter-like MFS transporter